MTSKLDNLSFVILREDGGLVAHCLQKNVVILGDSMPNVRENVDSFVEDYKSPDLQELIKKLPRTTDSYRKLYQEACEKGNFLDKYLNGDINLEFPMAYQIT